MHPNNMPAREPMTKKDKLNNYLKLKEETDRKLLDKFNKQEISQEIYCALIQQSEDGYSQFLKELNQNTNNQLDLDFKENTND